MSSFNIVAQSSDSTVVAEYKPDANRSTAYQSESQLEKEFIDLLKSQGYEYLGIKVEEDLISNLRKKLEELNSYGFSDDEWQRFFRENIANANEDIVAKTKKIQEDYIQVLKRDNGETKNIRLIDKDNIHNNKLQVINQYENSTENRINRYDVTVLVNGLPLVHIELKKRGVAIREAFNQINRYQRDTFWANSGLFEYVQIYVISNGTNTKYYSNSTRWNHIKESNSSAEKKEKTSNSFEFTSFWADAKNKTIPDLVDFTKTFFSKHTILNILTKYCVFTSDKMLLVMRPYQIVATEKILSKIEVANNYKKYGSIEGGGYIWHTTGSGKTLTSFKTAILATKLTYIEKVLFVVDRKDLDYQTMSEYDRFEKGAANSNTSTMILQRQLENPNVRIIITTIQKLDVFIKKNISHDIYNKHIVIIFDECHRSQFGQMHNKITKTFKKYHLFGFTGTPITTINSSSTNSPFLKTTEQAFGDRLHSYTIVDAINDKNVLPFKVDFIKTMDIEGELDDIEVWDIDREKAYMDPKRISMITDYILKHYNQKTYRNEKNYLFNSLTNIQEVAMAKDKLNVKKVKQNLRLSGFNSIFAVSSINAAKNYYLEFKKQMKETPNNALKIALIYSYGANEAEEDGILGEENSEDTTLLDKSSRDFLEEAIKDYNKMFKTNYDTSSDKFQNYYKDVSLRVKNREIDLLIVVNMFLTGFDATTLNTLWVDKNLKYHGLIQAFSRTNRILNSIKTFGNIVCFRNLQKRTNEAIALFGDPEAGGIVLIRAYKDYYYGYTDEGKYNEGYVDLVNNIINNYPVADPIYGETNQKEYIKLFGQILRRRNLLSAFDDFTGNEILTDRDMQDYQGKYNDLYDEWRKKQDKDKETINDDIVFEIELIKQIEINIDYILMLVKQYHDSHTKDFEIRIAINKAIDSSMQLRSKKELINSFIDGINDVDDLLIQWHEFLIEQKEKDLVTIIQEEKLKDKDTRRLMGNAFRDGYLKTSGTDIDNILPPVSRFGGGRKTTKEKIIEKLKGFFEKFFGISNS